MTTCVYLGEALARYSLGDNHPFGPARHDAFARELATRGLLKYVTSCLPAQASREQIEMFHTPEYVDRVLTLSETGQGFLDSGDTPAFLGMYEAAATVVGTTLAAIDGVMAGACANAFVPIAGLHHARRDRAAGFCVFNDCGVAIEYLRRRYGILKVGYVDIDAHHGDGVYYSFESDPDLVIADIHEDGRYLYPGTGYANETGEGAARGSKLNIPMPAGAGDAEFEKAWKQALTFIDTAEPEFILLQCGADSLAGDPLTHLRYTAKAHAQAAADIKALAGRCANGRIVAMGGGGYNLQNIADAWCGVISALGR
jgi:acetoin utilization protein AcuC